MKRAAFVALALAIVAVTYAAVGDRMSSDSLFGWFRPGRGLPALKSSVLPFRYPARLWRTGVEGEVILRLHITATGVVDSVVLERSSGDPQLDSVALAGATELKYHPAREGETPVAVWAELPVRFQRDPEQPVGVGGQ